MIQEADSQSAAQVDISLAQPDSQEIARKERSLVSGVAETINQLSLRLDISILMGSLDLAELRALLKACDTQMVNLNKLIGNSAWSEKFSLVGHSLLQIESWLAVLEAHFGNSEFSDRKQGLEKQMYAGLTDAKDKKAGAAVTAIESAIRKFMADQVALAAAAIERIQEKNVG
ncbi:hypothetical protein KA078_03375 [Candidatus Woesebacteria bacterium]|nr:hypothetical protein [Candidatus Woesebacteria bacterium]